jgi:hypothetical protein
LFIGEEAWRRAQRAWREEHGAGRKEHGAWREEHGAGRKEHGAWREEHSGGILIFEYRTAEYRISNFEVKKQGAKSRALGARKKERVERVVEASRNRPKLHLSTWHLANLETSAGLSSVKRNSVLFFEYRTAEYRISNFEVKPSCCEVWTRLSLVLFIFTGCACSIVPRNVRRTFERQKKPCYILSDLPMA